jgi:hypothetical protein
MVKLFSVLASIGMCLSAAAQGTFTYRFDWVGSSNLFHATFTVTQQDLNGQFQSDLFLSSMDVTTPLGRHYQQNANIEVSGDGRFIPWGLSFMLTDWTDQTQIDISGADGGFAYRTWGNIHTIGGPQGWSEDGHWNMTQLVPEPSVAALSILGTGCFLCFKRRARIGKDKP